MWLELVMALKRNSIIEIPDEDAEKIATVATLLVHHEKSKG